MARVARQIAMPRVPEAASAAGKRLAAAGGWLAGAVWSVAKRFGPLLLLLLAGAGLIASEFLTYREIMAVTVVPQGGITKGGEHHGYAIGLIGLVSLPM